MEVTSVSHQKAVPQWAAGIFHEHLDKNERLTHVLRLSIGGIRMIRGRHKALKILAEVEGTIDKSADAIAGAQKDMELAQREVDHDFPLLHEQATIALWSALEAMVRSFLASWLANVPEAWHTDAVKKLKVAIGEYESMEQTERCLWIVDLVDQQVSGPLRSGVTRFETLLQPFGLSGPVQDECQRALYELCQVRNALVHRSGVADKKLVEACPWLNLVPGQSLNISHKMWGAYNSALGEYTLEIVQRVRVHFGVVRYEAENLNPINT